MAKWGEGDPRWIVEERPDATNVNNWHWTEKNADNWSKQQLKSLLIGLEIEGDAARCIITDLDKCDGEAVVNNRKGKLIFLYEWDIVASWQGKLTNGNETIEGKVTIPNLSEENDISEIEVVFSVNNNSAEATAIKEYLHRNGKQKVIDRLSIYIKDLKEEFPKGLILPKKGDDAPADPKSNVKTTITEKTIINNSSRKTELSSVNKKFQTKTLTMSQCFQCTAADLYNALTVPQLAKCYASENLTLDAKKNGKFEFFGGTVSGTFENLVPNKMIVQKWRLKSWPTNHYSLVTITIEQQSDNTQVNLVQTEVPSSDYEQVEVNWVRYYWEPIKRYLGFGSYIL